MFINLFGSNLVWWYTLLKSTLWYYPRWPSPSFTFTGLWESKNFTAKYLTKFEFDLMLIFFGLTKLILILSRLINIEGKEPRLGDFIKKTSNFGLHSQVYQFLWNLDTTFNDLDLHWRSVIWKSRNLCIHLFSQIFQPILMKFCVLWQPVGLFKLTAIFFTLFLFKGDNFGQVILLELCLTLACVCMFMNQFLLYLVWWLNSTFWYQLEWPWPFAQSQKVIKYLKLV